MGQRHGAALRDGRARRREIEGHGPAPGAGRRRGGGDRGFTLIELAVTLLVLALAIGLAAPAIGRSTEAIRTRAEVARFSALLRHTRELAITSRRPHELVLEPAEHKVTIKAGDEVRATRPLPPDLAIAPTEATGLVLRFEPHGVTSGGEFHVQSGRHRYRVNLDALTGRVKVARL